MSASREASREQFVALIRKWNPAINLVAPATLDDIEARHISDCLQVDALSPPTASWVDLGSGGGLPGAILAIQRPETRFTLIESDKRKAAFLSTVARELDLQNVSVLSTRIEGVSPLGAPSVSARALAPLPLLLQFVARHMAPEGTAWLMKGRNWESEVAEARKEWQFSYLAHPSQTEAGAAILEVSDVRPKG